MNPKDLAVMYLQLCCSFCLACIVLCGVSAAEIRVQHKHAQACYAVGEEIVWTISVHGAMAGLGSYRLQQGGGTVVRRGAIDCSNGPQVITCRLDQPGSMLLTLSVPIVGRDKPLRKRCGALVGVNEIRPSLPKPKDFDQFWTQRLAEQAAIPMNAQLTPEMKQRPNVESWLLKLDTIRAQHIKGRLAKPQGPGKYPALIVFQWAGVYGLEPDWALKPASRGWLTLNVMAHDIPIDKDEAYYAELKQGALKQYAQIGNADRDTSYLLRMNLACARVVDYIAAHPAWNGRDVVVTGNSQGGYQALVAAGLHSKVTAVMTKVPAGCDHSGFLLGRGHGWPRWLLGDEGNQEKLTASRYYDAVNFAYQIRCPLLIAYGMGDTSSRVEGIQSALSVVQGPVHALCSPNGEHGSDYPRYEQQRQAWERDILKRDAVE